MWIWNILSVAYFEFIYDLCCRAVDLDSDIEEDTSKKKKNKKIGKVHDDADDLADDVQELSLNAKGKKDKKKVRYNIMIT